jgi:hypothetical protein
MRTRQIRLIGLIAGLALILGCGGQKNQSTTVRLLEDESDDVDIIEEITGIDDNTPIVVEKDKNEGSSETEPDSLEKDEDYVGGSQGVFLGKLMIRGDETPGLVNVRTATESNEFVRKGMRANTEISLEPGLYDFTFIADNVAGNPEVTLRDVRITAGRRTRKEVKMPVGEITLVTGVKCKKKPIKIRPIGVPNWYKGKYTTCVPIVLMAGEYEAEISTKNEVTPVSGIQVYDGSTRNVTIHSQ